MRNALLAATAAFALFAGSADAQTRTVRFSFNADANTLDPHANNALTTNALLDQMYECLTTRD